MQNPLKYPFWQKLRSAAARLYVVLRQAATVISIAFAILNVWHFISSLLSHQSA